MTTTDPIKQKHSEAVLTIDSYQNNIFEIINETKKFIMQNDCRLLDIDIMGLNMIDAVKVCVLCSTFHFSKYCSGKIKWIVKDEIVKSQIELLKLDNIEVDVKRAKRNYVDFSQAFNHVLSLCK